MKHPSNSSLNLQERLAWIYPWRAGGGWQLGTWLAVLVVTALFAVVWITVRVKVPRPVAWAAPQAGVMVVTDGGGISGEWFRRAVAMGPFPSRFELSSWSGIAAQQQALEEAARIPEEDYAPVLRKFPEVTSERSSLAVRGEPVLPRRSLPTDAPALGDLTLVPELAPLSGIKPADLPTVLPPFKAEVTPQLAAGDWRFLVCLDAHGRVLDCVSMSGTAEQGVLELRQWLCQVVFASSGAGNERWVGVRIGFKNRILNDGTVTD